jgi:predicted enzyme related to lactoylglutathione lyase
MGMAIQNIQLTTLFVSDQERALAFYLDKLGLEKRIDDMAGPNIRFIVVAPKGAPMGLVLSQGTADDGSAAKIGGATGLVFGADDVQKTYEELSGRGVEFAEPPVRQPWGAVQAQFLDPDKNVLILHEN